MRSIRNTAARFTLLVVMVVPVFVASAAAQYTTATGMPTFTTAMPLEMGFTNVSNGNLHIEIPLASFPQRGSLPYNARLVYDSLIWKIVGTTWQPTNVANSMGGWRLITGGEPGTVTHLALMNFCDTEPPTQRTVYTSFTWTAPDGTSHRFPIYTMRDTTICQEDISSDTEMADDSSGYTMSVTNYTLATVYAPDGTQLFPTVMDTNGNYFSADASGNIIDTLQRTPITVTTNGNTITYGILNPQGTRTNVTVTTTTVSANTSFGQSGVTECTNCSVTAIQSIAFADGSSYAFTYDSGAFAELASMTLRTGASVSYGYTTFRDGIGNVSRWLTSKTVGTNTWAFTPQAQSQTAQQVTVVEPTGDHIIYSFSLNNGAWVSGATYVDATRGTLLYLTNTWDMSNACPVNSGCSGSAFVRKLTAQTQFPGGLAKTVTYSYASAQTGQLSEVDESDYSTGTAPVLRKTLFSYATFPNAVSKPLQVTVKDGSNNVVSQVNYTYDQGTPATTTGVPQHASISGPRGNLTTLSRWLNTNNSNLNTTFTYDDTGNVLSSTDPGGHAAQFIYADNFSDSVNHNSLAYVTQITMPDTHSPGLAHHITHNQYDFNTGLLTAGTDQNGQQTTFTYDGFMRLLQTNFPDGGQTSLSYPSATQTVVQSKIDATRSTYATTLLDSNGRTSRTATANGEAVQYDLQDFCYDANGRSSFQSYPYQSNSLTGASVCSGAGDSFAYDVLGRPTTVTHSDNSSASVTYTGRARQITDEGNGASSVSRILQFDGLGRLTGVCEISANTLLGSGGTPASCGLDIAATGFLTSYSYNTLDKLIQVTQGSLNVRGFSYDSLSRMTSESHPEWGSGSTTTYAYNNDGMLIGRTRPAPNQTNTATTVTTNYGYDALHRLLSRTYTGDTSGTPSATFNYDEASAWSQTLGNTIGLMSSESSGSTGQAFSYNAVGRVLSNWQFTPRVWGGTPYLLSYGYDLAGDLTSAGNGAGVTFTNSYNIAGRLTGMTSSPNDANHPATLLTNVHYSPASVSDVLGNGLGETVGFSSRGQLQSYLGTVPGGQPGTGSVTISGSLQTYQQQTQAATQASGSITISGSEEAITVDPCGNYAPTAAPKATPNIIGSCPHTIWDSGTVTVTVNGHSDSVGYGSSSTTSTIASALAQAINQDANAPVTASASGATVSMVSKASGAGANYSFSTATATNDPADFFGPSFSASPSASSLSGGQNAVYQTAYDNGVTTITVNNHPNTYSWSGSGTTAASIAQGLSNAINADTGAFVTASTNGSTVSLVAKGGAGTNYPLSASSSSVVNSFSTSCPGFSSCSSASLTGAGNPAYSFTLGLAPDGEITSANDFVNGNWTFAYDQFNRLTGSNKNSGQQTFSYDYDRYSNRWHQNAPQGGPAPQYVFDNSTNRISGSGITYDALGDVLTDGLGNTYTYDAENRLITVLNSGGTYNYTYDAEGRRIKNASTEFVYDLAGRAVTLFNATTGGWSYGEIYAGGRHLATYSGGTTNFFHSDWLGTKRVMSALNGTISETCTGLPFGDGVNCTGTNWTFNGFTDDIHDSESNLEHTWFRQLSGTQGRWTTPDPYLGSMDLNNPQTLNRYAYVMNNPINLTDPSGLVCGGGDYDDCFFNFLAGAFGGGGGCTVNGIGAPCGFAAGLVNDGIGVRCDGSDCSKRRVGENGQWQVFIQWPGPSKEDPSQFFYSVSVIGHWFDLDTPIAYFSGVNGGWGSGGSNSRHLVVAPPCNRAGRAPDPSVYEAKGQAASTNEFKDLYYLFQFRAGGGLDAQPQGASPAYANYVYGVYMSAAGYTLDQALAGADIYAQYRSSYRPGTVMDPGHPFTPMVNVMNITYGFAAQQMGAICHK